MDSSSIDLGWLIWEVCKYTVLISLLIYFLNCIKFVREYERVVVFRLGRVRPVRGPGLVLIAPMIEKAVRVDMRVRTIELDPQDVITKDNVSVSMRAVLYYQVTDAVKSEVEIEDYESAAERLASTTLRYVGGTYDLDDVLSGAQRISERIKTAVDEQTEKWGIAITLVEIRNIDLPDDMKRAIAAQAEAERQRRAKVIAAQGEFEAAEKLCEAAKMMADNPISVQLRYMQTLMEIGAENNTTVVFPLPMELFPNFMNKVVK